MKRLLRLGRATPPLNESECSHEDIDLNYLQECLNNPQVLIEITSKCNFACTYCSSSFKDRPKLDMPMDLFERILGQLGDITSKNIRLHVDGEPTSHPQFHRMAKMVNDTGFRVALASNGSLLKRDFLDIDMDALVTISTNEDEFRERHRTMSFDKYTETITDYVRNWITTPYRQNLIIQVPLKGEALNSKDYRTTKEAWLRDWLDKCGITSDAKEGLLTENRVLYRKPKGALRICPINIVETGLYPRNGIRSQCKTTTIGFCDSAWKRLTVFADGSVGFCCIDLSGRTAYTAPKEIWEKPLKDIWSNHPRIQAIRTAFSKRRVPVSVCQECLAATPDHTRRVAFNS